MTNDESVEQNATYEAPRKSGTERWQEAPPHAAAHVRGVLLWQTQRPGYNDSPPEYHAALIAVIDMLDEARRG